MATLLGVLALPVPLCPFALLTRHPCPGCGLTRATVALVRGHLEEALHLHPLVLLVVPGLAGWLSYAATLYVLHGRWDATGARSNALAVAGLVLWVLLLGVWIARFFGAFGGPVPVSIS